MITTDLFLAPKAVGPTTLVAAQPDAPITSQPVQEQDIPREITPEQKDIAAMQDEDADLIKTLGRLVSANAELRAKLAHMRSRKPTGHEDLQSRS